MFLTPSDIDPQTLKSGRGYDREDVDTLLKHVASSYEQVWRERYDLRACTGELEEELKGFRESERLVRDTLVTAQRAADDLRSRAERDAERIKSEALADLGRAKAEAERELGDLRAEIAHARRLERELRSSIRAFLEQTLRKIEDSTLQEAPLETPADARTPEAPTAHSHDG